ncbi:MAG: ShlB/FhaC/HecB family hemolysin secretion/activation protein [Rhodospirillales bacterium]|nr:ShlB/FhaC/HecB family hemolysin secretion/activation protein [Rhodospirillales bacterium]
MCCELTFPEETTLLTQYHGSQVKRRSGAGVAFSSVCDGAGWRRLAVVGLVTGLSAMAGAPAHSQAVPGPALVPQGSPLPQITPVTPPAVAPGPSVPRPGPINGANANAEVVVRSVAVDGSTAYPAARLAALTQGLVGRVKIGQIETARQAILDRYRTDGYLLTTVSATVDPAGALRFVVIEGRIADVKLDGDIGPAGVQVLRFLNHLKDVRPIDTASLERWLLLAQDVPGVSLRAVLRPSTDEPGALQLVAQVQRKAYSGLFTADNRASPYTGPEQALAIVSLNSFSQFGEKTEIWLYHAFPNTQTFGQVANEVFLGGTGLKLRVYAGSGTADPSGSLRSTGYHGVTTTAGVSLSYPVIRARRQTLSVGTYFDVLESNIHTGDPQVLNSRDNLRVIRLGADYALQDLWLGGDRSAVNSASFRVSKGLSILGASPSSDPLAGRLGEKVDFTKLSFELSRTQTLVTLGTNSSIGVQVTLAGQFSNDVLPAAEKFFLGGARWNRGYYSGQVTGDTALSSAVELQFNTGFVTEAFSRPIEIGAQFYGFYDWGETWESQRQDANHRVYSAGGGVRLSVTRSTEVDIEGVTRMTRRPLGTAANVQPLRAQAVFWRVLTRF